MGEYDEYDINNEINKTIEGLLIAVLVLACLLFAGNVFQINTLMVPEEEVLEDALIVVLVLAGLFFAGKIFVWFDVPKRSRRIEQ